jgi:hypothetical protein
MNKKFFYGIAVIALALCATESNAQDKVFVRGYKLGESPFSNLEPGYKFTVTDTTVKSVDVCFYFEEYEKNKKDSTYLWLTRSFKSKLVFEVVGDDKPREIASDIELPETVCLQRMYICISLPGFIKAQPVCPMEGYKIKWRYFAASKEKDKAPLILCYEEKENETAIEKKLETLFGKTDITMNKEEVIRKIKPVVEKYWMMSYNLKSAK